MGWRDEIFEVVQPHNLTPSLLYWTRLLNFTEEHADSLSLDELGYLARESERCRKFWNSNHEKVITIHKNGKSQEQKLISKGLDIPRDDVFPNIDRIIEQKLERQRIREEFLEQNKPTRNESSLPANVIPLAASSK